jgi:glycosyltransferase involved in cell wall biosynthesis
MNNKLLIITNESISMENNKFSCDNIDMKSIPEALQESNFSVSLLARKSQSKRTKNIGIENIKTFGNIFLYLFELFKNIKNTNNTYLIISISPYTFLAVIFLAFYKKKPFVYLRSDGYKEYKTILGFYGSFIYHIMFILVGKFSYLIACRDHLLNNRRGETVNPSQLNDKWFCNQRTELKISNNLLYVGRIRVEKGIFSLVKMLENSNLKLTIITPEKKSSIPGITNNISIVNFENKNDEIINCYDEHNIFILPSYTEAHPQVLDEALARHKPVIIFKEISHVIRNRKGVFVSKRNIESLEKTIDYIIKDYDNIINEIKKNILPTKKQFIEQLNSILKQK